MNAKIVEKIKNLLNKTEENGATPAEVASAMALAQKLMVKYHIEESELSDVPEEIIDSDIEEKTKTSSPFHKILVTSLAHHFRCEVYLRGGKIRLFGYPTDVEIFKVLLSYLFKAFEHSAKSYLASVIGDRSEKLAHKNTFGMGYVKGVLKALSEQEAEDSKYALIVVPPDAVVTAFKEKSKDFRKSSTSMKQSNSPRAFVSGYDSGINDYRMRNKTISYGYNNL